MNKKLVAAIFIYITVLFIGFREDIKDQPAIVLATSEPTPITQTIEVIYTQPPVITESLGEFEITYYTAGVESTGKSPGHPAYGITKSGATVREGVTVAVDPTVIPLGTYLYIEGIGFRVAQDIGGAIKGNKIDIYVPTVKEARNNGRHKAEVYLLQEVPNE